MTEPVYVAPAPTAPNEMAKPRTFPEMPYVPCGRERVILPVRAPGALLPPVNRERAGVGAAVAPRPGASELRTRGARARGDGCAAADDRKQSHNAQGGNKPRGHVLTKTLHEDPPWVGVLSVRRVRPRTRTGGFARAPSGWRVTGAHSPPGRATTSARPRRCARTARALAPPRRGRRRRPLRTGRGRPRPYA